LRITAAEYVVLLNSATVVTPGWLDRMVACAESDAKIGIVGPLSNAASWQSVPHVFNTRGDDWACNVLPPGMSVADYSRLIARYSGQVYPRIPLLNGFCLMIRRKVIESIGYFDEEVFRNGYGGGNDYCMRARNAGWELAVADDAYVFHAQSRNHSHDRRKVPVKQLDEALIRRYGAEAITRDVVKCRFDRVLEGVRARCGAALSRMQWVDKGQSRFEGKRIAFVLYAAMPSDGGHVILQEAKAMLDMGVDVRVVNLTRHRKMFERSYPGRTVPVVYVEEDNDVQGLLRNYDAVVATFHASLEWIGPSQPQAVASVRGYYIQDVEPFFFTDDSRECRKALESHTRYPDLVRFTKTEWHRQVVKERTGADSVVVGPSVDIDAFRPRRRRDGDWPLRPLRVAAMVRPATPRGRPDLTMRILERLYLIHRDNIQICILGSRPDDAGFLNLPHAFPCWHAGVLTRDELAGFFNEVDVFADLSSWQAMGLSITQAMACGVAVVAPRQGGAGTVINHEGNGLLVDSSSEEECFEALNRLVIDERLRGELQRRAIYDICQYPPERAAYAVLDALFFAQR
jgi:glycosyltransferase involved in cell wall biosynthesis